MSSSQAWVILDLNTKGLFRLPPSPGAFARRGEVTEDKALTIEAESKNSALDKLILYLTHKKYAVSLKEDTVVATKEPVVEGGDKEELHLGLSQTTALPM